MLQSFAFFVERFVVFVLVTCGAENFVGLRSEFCLTCAAMTFNIQFRELTG
jgi:hypothetical protein